MKPMKNKDENEFKNFFSKLKIMKANFKATLIAITILIIYCLVIGVILFSKGNKLYEFEHQIDETCFNNKCEINFIIKEDQDGPFYVYIKYLSFYLNHRNIAFSVDWSQINGDDFDSGNPKGRCGDYYENNDGEKFYPDVFKNKKGEGTMNPCGLFSLLYVKCFLNR